MRLWLWADAAALAALAFAVYANTLTHGFTFDDQFAILTNGDVLEGARYAPSLRQMFLEIPVDVGFASPGAAGTGAAVASPEGVVGGGGGGVVELGGLAGLLGGPLWVNDFWGQDLPDMLATSRDAI